MNLKENIQNILNPTNQKRCSEYTILSLKKQKGNFENSITFIKSYDCLTFKNNEY